MKKFREPKNVLEVREQTEACEAQNSLSRFVNSMSFDPQWFVQAELSDHPTLQQSFVRLIVAYLFALAEFEPYEYDLRLEASVKLAKQFKQAVEDGTINAGLPYI